MQRCCVRPPSEISERILQNMIPFLKRFREAQRPRCTALVAAAGSSSRMGGVNKLLEPLDGIPVLVRTLDALQRAQRVDAIIIATREEDLIPISQLCHTYGITKCAKVVRGGESRTHSVLLAALESDAGTELLAVQDGARPLVTPELIDDVIAAAARCGAAAPAVPVKDTVKVVRPDGTVDRTLDRSTLMAVQTPQVFTADLLKAALQAVLEERIEVTDDCAAVERLGKEVYLTEGAESNLKITTPGDLILAEALLHAEEIER
jgi:2-C-methyl-D-erythritol 4-phosphate cytidylyltransferase